MTALWVCTVILFVLWFLLAAVVVVLWVYCAGMTAVVNSHRRDENAHWSTRWEDDADA